MVSRAKIRRYLLHARFRHEKPINKTDENTCSGKHVIGEKHTNKIKTITKEKTINNNTNVLLLANAENPIVEQKQTYGLESINEAFNWWEQAFGYELKPSQQNRRAVYNMLRAKNKGEEWLKKMLALLVEAKRDKYSGIHIANYADLQRDWEKLLAWGSSKYEQKTSTDSEFDRLVSQL